jgi:hypothetical protein
LIYSGPVDLAANQARETWGPIVNFWNATAYSTYRVLVTSVAGSGGGAQYSEIKLLKPANPLITSSPSATAVQGVPFTFQISALNNSVAFSAQGLPSGLTLDSTSGLISGIATSAGTSTAVVGAVNASGSQSQVLSIVVETPYTAWQNQIFTPDQLADPTVSGDTAAPACDGIPNLMKFALHLLPLANGAAGLPVISAASVSGTTYPALIYRQNLTATDIVYNFQVSNDLLTWNSGSGFTSLVNASPNPDGVTETVTVRSNTPLGTNGPPQFLRLQVISNQ